MLIEQQLLTRPDWDNVVAPVVDYALSRPDVDPGRIALIGWSFADTWHRGQRRANIAWPPASLTPASEIFSRR